VTRGFRVDTPQFFKKLSRMAGIHFALQALAKLMTRPRAFKEAIDE